MIIVVDGASASSRARKDRLGQVVFESIKRPFLEIRHSFFKSKTMRALTAAVAQARADENVLIIAKSQGAWRVLDWLKKADRAINLRRFFVVTIDPHHWALGNETIMGVPRLGALTNIYQLNRYPRGARVACQDNRQIENAGVDHWNIIHTAHVGIAIKCKLSQYEGKI